MVTLRLPASSANLGPGFDCLGIGLSLYLRCQAQALPEGALEISGCPAKYQGANNLIYQSFLKTLNAIGHAPMGVNLRVDSDIPAARGLGSSAAAIACGVAAAFALSGQTPDKDSVFRLTAQLEGHGDNAAAAVYGGLRAAMQQGESYRAAAFPLHTNWRFTALVPPFELSTKAARAALPSHVPYGDAVFNVGRSVMVLKALEDGDMDLLQTALHDKLHQPYRLPLIDNGREVMQAAQRLCAAVYVSGAGPTLMCVHQQESLHHTLASVLPEGWHALPLTADNQGLTVE